MALITAIRREKAEKRKPLNAPIKRLIIYAGRSEFARILSENKADIVGTCKIEMIEILSEKGRTRGIAIQEFPETAFTSEY